MDFEHKAIRDNLERVQEEVTRQAQSAGRRPEDVKIVVVTKQRPPEVIQAAIEAGARFLGENYPDEAVSKIEAIGKNPQIQWHMIGHVQSRKARIVASHFNVLHSLDSLRLAEKLNRLCMEQGRTLPVCLEVNIGGEESKGGWEAWDEERWEDFRPVIETCLEYEHLPIKGLMVMPPWSADAEKTRPFFVRTRRLCDYLNRVFPQLALTELSMGTSIDYAVAVQEGATYIRVGEAILGERTKKAQPPQNIQN